MGFLKKLFSRKVRTNYLDGSEMEAITNHFDRHVGDLGMVYHEIVSDAVHIDVYTVPDVPGRDFIALYTTGMSALPMPGASPDEAYAELFVLLPKDWPLEDEELKRDENFWPLQMMKAMARVPTDYGAAIKPGISMPNGNPAEAFPGSNFYGVMIGRAEMFPLEFRRTRIGDREVNFYPVVPMTKEEMEWKVPQESGTALLDRYRSEGRDPVEVALFSRNRPSFV